MNCKKASDTPEWLISKLVANGLSRTQAASQTAEIVIQTLNTDDNNDLIAYTKSKCDTMIRNTQSQISEMKATHEKLSNEVSEISNTILAIKSASEEWGGISDQRAKDAISLYSALLEVSKKHGATDITGASYIVYAYLGGDKSVISKNDKDRVIVEQPVAKRRGAKSEDYLEF